MLVLVVFIVIFIIVNQFIVLEEEVLILLAAIVWLDAAGSFFKQFIWTSLENKGNIIKEKLLGYLNLKISILEMLIERLEKKRSYSKLNKLLRDVYILKFVSIVVLKYIWEWKIIKLDSLWNNVAYFGVYGINHNLKHSLKEILDNVNNKG